MASSFRLAVPSLARAVSRVAQPVVAARVASFASTPVRLSSKPTRNTLHIPKAAAAADKCCPTTDHKEYADLVDILRNNRDWVRRVTEEDPEFFKGLAKGQQPKYFYIGCADSRVPANEIMGLGPGEVFVHRNVANMVVGTDTNFLACLQFAVNVLEVDHIIVCGHYDCGGVRAALTNKDHGTIEQWLGNIRDVARLHHKELQVILDMEDRCRRLVELNVIEQCLNIFKINFTQARRAKSFAAKDPFTKPRVHGLVYSPGEGILHKLDIDFKSLTEPLNGLYDLYDPNKPSHIL